MPVYRASADAFVWGLTAGLVALLLLISAVIVVTMVFIPNLGIRIGLGAAVVLCLGILVGAWMYGPRAYELRPDAVVVRRPVGNVEIPVESIRDVSTFDEWLGFSVKTFPGGNSGLFGMYGTFYNAKLGHFRMYAQRARGGVIIETETEKIVVTPDERDSFVRELEQRVQAQAGAGAVASPERGGG
jgi:hypothetical protein